MAKAKTSASETKARSNKGGGQWRWLWLTFSVVALDLLTKNMANFYLSHFSSETLTSFLDIVLVYNTGSAFGFLADQSGWQLWLFVSIAVTVTFVILAWLWRSSSMHYITALGLSLLLGGTLGNLYDRIVDGYVVDFIDLHYHSYHWPAFNIADMAICLGAFCLILSAFRKD